jgi:thiol-disulfide isomerase/thioredoxin
MKIQTLRTAVSRNLRGRWFAAAFIVGFSWSVTTCMAQDTKPEQADLLKRLRTSLSENMLEDALVALGEMEEANMDVPYALRQQLLLPLIRGKRLTDASEQAETLMKQTHRVLAEEANATPFMNAWRTANAVWMSSQQSESAMKWLETGMQEVRSKIPEDELSQLHSTYSEMLKEQWRLSRDAEKRTQRAREHGEHIAKSEAIFAKQLVDETASTTMLKLWNDAIQLASDEDKGAYFDKATLLASDRLQKSPTQPVIQVYSGLASAYASSIARSDPDAATTVLEQASKVLDAIETEDTNLTNAIGGFRKSTERIQKVIETSRALLALHGQDAPAWDAAQWVHGEPTTQQDMLGKVVLLDFWAVWCGPCIATFPHLRHLEEAYGDKGLRIIGVTKPYNFRWNEEESRAERSEGEESLESELAMLEKFLEHHQLKHRSMVTPNDSSMSSNYLVTGIPHAVLIDKMGKIRMVKIGSGEKNAEDIESMVQKLLAE